LNFDLGVVSCVCHGHWTDFTVPSMERTVMTSIVLEVRYGDDPFETWLDQIDAVGARIDAAKMFTYSTSDLARLVALIADSNAVSRA
jgi:thiamine biosynthesis lipoprotein ApbE